MALTESGLPAPYTPSPSCRAALGCECYSQNTPRATAPKTASEWLLPGSQSLRVLLTLAQCCPCGASLGCLGARRVLGSSILSPPLLPSWEMEPTMPTPWRCQHLGSASTSAVPAALPTPAQDCTGSLSPKRARVGEEGEAPWGRTAALRVPLLAEAVPAAWQGAGRGCCHASAAPRAAPGLVLWFAHVVGAQGGCRGDSAAGRGAEVSFRTPGRAAVAWRGAGAAGGCSGCP